MSHYDRVIIGAGLSGLSLCDRWTDPGALPRETRIAVIDPNYESIQNRTFAFWRPKSNNEFRYSSLVEKRWNRFRVTPLTTAKNRAEPLSFESFVYEKISGLTFYSHLVPKIFRDPRFEKLNDNVEEVTEENNLVRIRLSSGLQITADQVWTSVIENDPKQILQHFLGYEIETEEDVFQPDIAELMDFRIPQEKQTRFIYILPYSSRSALIEFTVFSPDLLETAQYEKHLETYITETLRVRRYRIIRKERGVVPMGLESLPKFVGSRIRTRIVPIGAAAGLVKASTGYSFARNQRFLDRLSQKAAPARWRFYIYDSLLLGIIRQDGSKLATILPHLFAANAPEKVFRFLDEESHFGEELRIFYSLPWPPFLKNLVLEFPFFFALGLTVVITPYGHLLIPLLGLFLFGISHGARDHLLLAQSSLLKFVILYVSAATLFVALWWVRPAVALVVFLLVSIEHFGSCQFLRALKLSSGALFVRLPSVLWGAFAALGAPLFHWSEALPILRSILRGPNALADVPSSFPQNLAIGLSGLALGSAWIMDKYELKATARTRTSFISTSFLIATFAFLPLLPGFLCYFAFWHSVDSINQQRARVRLDRLSYFKEALPISLVSWLGAAALFFVIGLNWGLFFVGLAAITLPHSAIMHRFYSIKKNKA